MPQPLPFQKVAPSPQDGMLRATEDLQGLHRIAALVQRLGQATGFSAPFVFFPKDDDAEDMLKIGATVSVVEADILFPVLDGRIHLRGYVVFCDVQPPSRPLQNGMTSVYPPLVQCRTEWDAAMWAIRLLFEARLAQLEEM